MDPEALKLIEDLEAEMANLVGDARSLVRRKLRRLRQKAGSGIPMARVRGARTRAGKATSIRVQGETPEDALERHKRALAGLSAHSGRPPETARAVAYPISYPTEILLAKFEAYIGYPPSHYTTIDELPTLIIFW